MKQVWAPAISSSGNVDSGVVQGFVFSKLSGQGNDFIIVDNRREHPVKSWPAFARLNCDCRRSVGADGVLVIGASKDNDFRLRIFNADGSEADMCGNGARCAAVYAVRKNIVLPSMTMETGAGPIRALVDGNHATIRMTAVRELQTPVFLSLRGLFPVRVFSIDSGVPHAVAFTGEESPAMVFETTLKAALPMLVHRRGRELRNHPRWGKQGSNVDFVEILDESRIYVRTYERGVEAETRACGTGAVASAFAARRAGYIDSETIVVEMPGGVLSVFFQKDEKGGHDAWLAGPVDWICEGALPRESEEEQG